MRKTLSIALMLVTATVVVPAASADPTLGERIIAQENAKNTYAPPETPSAVDLILAQERARASDPALFGPVGTPIQIVGPTDDFDLRDAGVGGALVLALALLTAALVAVRNGARIHPATPKR